ncbi:MAG: glycine C-acetyltransferase [Sphingomonadaceae bacterium]|nr:glycine C-acetyltransferase [Sphingomonadaceae bacterium]MCP5384435.1 glycine C-acetyltransferase [Altererythrobacter sp.]MCP5390694.1 glycine C-acetyltransferase [Sphingomonadaceae bacterium]MCP5393761.1 glycine C-acetyltransferase [Sphingomonadaceae bacterium]
MSNEFYARIAATLQEIEEQGLWKPERLITSPQGAKVTVKTDAGTVEALNFCANNYLGLADNAQLSKAQAETNAQYGFGMASVRFICGTLDLHRTLERKIAGFFGYEDSITFAACFDANSAVFEPLLGEEDAIISDSLNHASIIDGVRLCKAKRYRYANNRMAELEEQLKQADADGARTKLIVTDGVFSMDGIIADLEGICDLADKYNALVMVDDCHAAGFMGENGRGSPEYRGVVGRIDILTGTLGKALGGGMGGYICAKQEVIDLLRQRARPYLFSNALAPGLVGASLKMFEMLGDNGLRETLRANAARFRKGMTEAGFDLIPGEHPIIPVMLGEARLAGDMAAALLDEGVFVTGFSFPVVPRGAARIRTQMSAAHTADQVDFAVDAFTRVGRKLGVI